MLSTLCLSNHPNQPHLIVAGYDNGSICFCDLRQEKVPISCIQAHAAEGKNKYYFLYTLCKINAIVS